MSTTVTIVMICACIIIFVLLGIAVVVTIDIFRRIDTLEIAEKKLNEITKTVASLNKLKLELEEEVFKYKLLRETKEERKRGNRILDNSNSTNIIHSDRNIISSSTNNSNTSANLLHSKEDN